MKLILEADKHDFSTGEAVVIRLLALNDSYRAIALDRRLLVGPNPVFEVPQEPPFPVSLEPAFAREEQNLIMLNPWCFYGRQRIFDNLPPGSTTIYAYLLRQMTRSLPPKGPLEPAALLAAAEPLVVISHPR